MLKSAFTGVFLAIASLAGAAALTCVQAGELSGRQISELIAGATIEIDTPTGTKIPVRHSQEGRLAGDARDLSWYLGSATDVGRWWVAGDQLCHKWVRWFNAEPQCLRISQEGRAFRWRNQEGNTGTAAITVPAPVQQASTWLTLPRVFPRKAPEAAALAPADTPPAEPPRLQEQPETAAVSPPPAETWSAEAKPETVPSVVAPAPAPAAKAPPQLDANQAPAKVAGLPPPKVHPAPVPAAPPRPPVEARTINAPPKQAVERAPQPTFMVTNVRHDDVLNVRSGPSADFEVVGELQPGNRGIAITSECRSRWCPVQHDNATGWVNSVYLAPEGPVGVALQTALNDRPAVPPVNGRALRDSPEAPRRCLKPAARALLDRIEQTFGAVQVISTCRPGALIAGTNHPSRHASGNAVDFKADTRKGAIIQWLLANHRAGGVMTYAGMDHIHIDIGPRFVSLAGSRHVGGRHVSSWRGGPGAARASDVDDN